MPIADGSNAEECINFDGLLPHSINQYDHLNTNGEKMVDLIKVRIHEQVDRLPGTTDIATGPQIRKAKVVRRLKNFLNMEKLKDYSTGCLKDRGSEEKKWPMFPRARSGTICVQSDQHLYCLKGNTSGTVERT